MAAATLLLHMDERGSYFVNIATADRAGAPKAPLTLNWTLTNRTGKIIINNRKEVVILNPTASETVVLNNGDCALLEGEKKSEVIRIFTVKGTYDCDLGSGLNLRGRCYIKLDNYEALPLA